MDFEPAPFLRRLSLAVAAVFLGATAAAQIPIPAVVDPNADAPVQTGVSVDDSVLAVDRMALATRLEGEKEWNKSAEVYQEVIEKYRDKVVPVPTNTKGLQDLIAQYTSVLNLVNQQLRQWPPEGLAVYKAHYELNAQALVTAAHGNDLGPLHEAFSRYFVTDAGKQAGLKLIDAYFEMGDFNAAIWIGNELRLHPSLDTDTPKVLFRIGLAAHFSGDAETAQGAWQDLKTGYPNATATIGGRDVTLVTELQSYLGRPVALPGGVSDQPGNSWPTLGGDASRGKIYSSLAQPQARLYSFKLPSDVPLADRNLARDYVGQNQSFRSANPGAAVGIMPVVDRGELYFQDNAHVYAFGLESGQPLPGWTTDPNRKFGRYTVKNDAWTLPNGRQLGLTLTDNRVLGIMNMPELFTAPSNAGFRTGDIVCLDRATGAQQWTFSPATLPDASLQQISLGGTPLVVGNNVYCMGRISNENEIRCYVLCVDLDTGVFRWSCYVATAPNTGPVLSQDSRFVQLADNFSSLAYAGGRIFVSTNFGAVAALDAYGGTIDWLNVYKKPDDSIPQQYLMNRGFGRFNNFNNNGMNTPDSPGTPPAWIGNAPIVHNGKVFVLPPEGDGDNILVYDADHGQVVKMLNKTDCCPTSVLDGSRAASPPRTLLGVIDGATVLDGGQDRQEDLLLLGTDKQVFAIKWREYDPANPSAAVAWATTPGAAETIGGRTMVTANHLYIPGSSSMHFVSLRNGAIEQNYPAFDAPWPAEEGPGNVVVCADHVVIASDTHINVYTNLSTDRARLDGQIAAAPADAQTRLQYAETMFLANQPAEAMKKLDDAIQLLPRGNAPQAVATRNRAFADALDFGVKSWRVPAAAAARALPGGDKLEQGKILADGFFRRASGLAQSPGQQVNYRLAAARFARYGNQDIGAAIKLYQEILCDAAMRSCAAVDKDDIDGLAPASAQLQSMPLQAGRVAAAAIESMMIDQKGHLAYGPYEQAAGDELTAATAAKDPARMANVALSYPNSTVWGTAAFAAIDGYERIGLYPQSLQLLRYIYAIVAPDNVHDRVVILQKMAADYMQMPGRVEVALGRLEAADQLERTAKLLTPFRLASGKILPIGTPVIAAINELEHALPDEGAAATARLAAFGFPSSVVDRDYYTNYKVHPQPLLPEDSASAIPNITALLAPDQPFARYDRIVAWTAGTGLSIYPAGKTDPLGTDPDARTEPRGAAWVAVKSDSVKSDLLAWNSAALSLIGGEDVRTRWTVDMQSQPALDVMAPKPVPPKYNADVPQQNPQQFGGNFGGGNFGGGFGRGRGGRNRQGLLINGQQVYQRQTIAGSSGAAATEIADDSIESIAAVRPVAGMAIVSTTAGRVMAIDLTTGAVHWQVRVSTHALDRLEATDDFTVVKTTDDPNALIMALDTVTGRLIWHQSFGGEDQIAGPVNFALGQDGRLAFTTPDQLFIVRLFEAMRMSDPQAGLVPPTAAQAGSAPFEGMTLPGQLIVTDGQVLAICDEGRALRGYNAETGQMRIIPKGNMESEMMIPINNGTPQTVIQPAGAYVYAWNAKAMVAYNLENPARNWENSFQDRGDVRQVLLGRDYLVVMGRAPGDELAQAWTLTACLRATPTIPSGAESGRIVYTSSIQNAAGIVAFQMIDGGLCYLSNDHVLHTLKANRNPTPPTPPPAP
jgi:outer membrane protein assembly factor BamB